MKHQKVRMEQGDKVNSKALPPSHSPATTPESECPTLPQRWEVFLHKLKGCKLGTSRTFGLERSWDTSWKSWDLREIFLLKSGTPTPSLGPTTRGWCKKLLSLGRNRNDFTISPDIDTEGCQSETSSLPDAITLWLNSFVERICFPTHFFSLPANIFSLTLNKEQKTRVTRPLWKSPKIKVESKINNF